MFIDEGRHGLTFVQTKYHETSHSDDEVAQLQHGTTHARVLRLRLLPHTNKATTARQPSHRTNEVGHTSFINRASKYPGRVEPQGLRLDLPSISQYTSSAKVLQLDDSMACVVETKYLAQPHAEGWNILSCVIACCCTQPSEWGFLERRRRRRLMKLGEGRHVTPFLRRT